MLDGVKSWLWYRLVTWASPFPVMSIYAPGHDKDGDVPVRGVILATDEDTLDRIIKGWTYDSAEDDYESARPA